MFDHLAQATAPFTRRKRVEHIRIDEDKFRLLESTDKVLALRQIDADFAAETANLSRAQILQQAGTAMVAQANQLPQQVLNLLKG